MAKLTPEIIHKIHCKAARDAGYPTSYHPPDLEDVKDLQLRKFYESSTKAINDYLIYGHIPKDNK